MKVDVKKTNGAFYIRSTDNQVRLLKACAIVATDYVCGAAL